MNLDLHCVEAFLVVLEEGGFRPAADRLFMSPSALTKRIQRLEQQLGADLLVRDEAGVAGPTSAGLNFEPRARALLAAARRAQQAAQRERALTLRLGVSGPVGDFPEWPHLLELGQRLRELHPDVRLVCHSVGLPDMHSSLLDGEVDAVFVAFQPAPAAVELVPKLNLERRCVVPFDHDLADAGQISADELAKLSLLYIPDTPPPLMFPFVLGDVRPVRHARLAPAAATHTRSFIEQLGPRQAAVIGASSHAASVVRPDVKELRITDLPAIPMFATRRASDRRQAVSDLVELLPSVAASISFHEPVPASEA